jgi:hypothetical protein
LIFQALLIIAAFLVTLSIYLLILGIINRRSRPLIVPGPWDFAGILLAASGFLVGGVFALSAFNDNWRDAALFGHKPTNTSAESLAIWPLVSMIAYFVVVIAGAGYFLWRSRHHTSIYNVDLETVQSALVRIFDRLGLRPVRSGDMYYLAPATGNGGGGPLTPEKTGIQQAPNDIPASGNGMEGRPQRGVQTAAQPRAPGMGNVILELDAFKTMWHVTLRWDPPHSGLRQDVERELDQELAETPSPMHSLGAWLTLLACLLFFLAMSLGTGLVLYRFLTRI